MGVAGLLDGVLQCYHSISLEPATAAVISTVQPSACIWNAEEFGRGRRQNEMESVGKEVRMKSAAAGEGCGVESVAGWERVAAGRVGVGWCWELG